MGVVYFSLTFSDEIPLTLVCAANGKGSRRPGRRVEVSVRDDGVLDGTTHSVSTVTDTGLLDAGVRDLVEGRLDGDLRVP